MRTVILLHVLYFVVLNEGKNATEHGHRIRYNIDSEVLCSKPEQKCGNLDCCPEQKPICCGQVCCTEQFCSRQNLTCLLREGTDIALNKTIRKNKGISFWGFGTSDEGFFVAGGACSSRACKAIVIPIAIVIVFVILAVGVYRVCRFLTDTEDKRNQRYHNQSNDAEATKRLCNPDPAQQMQSPDGAFAYEMVPLETQAARLMNNNNNAINYLNSQLSMEDQNIGYQSNRQAAQTIGSPIQGNSNGNQIT